jgi:hypothetical protein
MRPKASAVQEGQDLFDALRVDGLLATVEA